MGKRECFEKRLHLLWSDGSLVYSRNSCYANTWFAKPESLVREKEEAAIANYRSTKHSTKIILSKRRLSEPKTVCKPIVRIKRVVTKVFEEGSMKMVRPRATYCYNLSTWHATK